MKDTINVSTLSFPNYSYSVIGTDYPMTKEQAKEFIKETFNNINKERKDDQSMTTKVSTFIPARIDQYGTATVVHWSDGSFTAVNCGNADSNNVYAAFSAALAKKIFGSTSMAHKIVDRSMGSRLDELAERIKKQNREEQLAAEKRNHDRKVRALAKEMMMKAEAFELIQKEQVE